MFLKEKDNDSSSNNNTNDTDTDDHHNLEDMKDEYHQSDADTKNDNLNDSNSTNTNNSNVNSTTSTIMDWNNDSVIMRDDDDHAETIVDNFFINIDRTKDSSISLCKLADLNFRLNRAKKNSDEKIQQQLDIERKRNEDYSKDLAYRQEHMKNYTDGTNETEIYAFVRQLKVGLEKGIIIVNIIIIIIIVVVIIIIIISISRASQVY